MIFDAQTLSAAWLSVALASQPNDDTPSLDRTILIEQHEHGIRLIATDTYLMISTFVPSRAAGVHDQAEPDLDEAPLGHAVAIDKEARAKALMTHLWKLSTKGEEPPNPDVEIEVARLAADGAEPTLDGMDPIAVTITRRSDGFFTDELSITERITLPVFEGDYPTWRSIHVGINPTATKTIALGPEKLGRIAKLGAWNPERILSWEWCGKDKPARVTIGDRPKVTALVMPVRLEA